MATLVPTGMVATDSEKSPSALTVTRGTGAGHCRYGVGVGLPPHFAPEEPPLEELPAGDGQPLEVAPRADDRHDPGPSSRTSTTRSLW